MATELMAFTADLAREIQAQRGRVTKLTMSESDEPQYAHCYHIYVEDGVRWTEYWVTHAAYTDGMPMTRIVEYLLLRLKNGDPVTMHTPERIEEAHHARIAHVGAAVAAQCAAKEEAGEARLDLAFWEEEARAASKWLGRLMKRGCVPEEWRRYVSAFADVSEEEMDGVDGGTCGDSHGDG